MARGVLLGLLLASGCQSVDRQAPGAVLDLRGRSVDPFQHHEARAIAFVFVRTDCPISNRYAPEIQHLYMEYGPQGIDFLLVFPDPDAASAEITKHLRDYQLSLPAVRDPRRTLAKRAGVHVTPEVAVFSPDGHNLYKGRIDNRFVDFGRERPTATQHDLADALTCILAGRPVSNSVTTAIGCYIPDLP